MIKQDNDWIFKKKTWVAVALGALVSLGCGIYLSLHPVHKVTSSPQPTSTSSPASIKKI